MMADSQEQTQNDNQSQIKTKIYKTRIFNDDEAHTSTPLKKRRALLASQENVSPNTSFFNGDPTDLLKQILDSLRTLNERVSKIEDNMVEKSEMLAQNKLLRECKVAVHKIETSVCRMTGELRDKQIEEKASTLPLESLCALSEVEEKLKCPEYAQAMATYLHTIKGASDDVEKNIYVLRKIFTDSLLEKFNWEGRWEEEALNKVHLVETILRDVFKLKGGSRFEKAIKKAVDLSHHRQIQKKHQTTKKKIIFKQ